MLEARIGGNALSDADALALFELPAARLIEAAGALRERVYGRRVTYSPKVFLPLTNLCRNRCGYCSFRKDPDDPAAWTMTPDQVEASLALARTQGCAEALLCLGDKPEKSSHAYRRLLASWGHDSTVSYVRWACLRALEHGLLPHTNAGILDLEDMCALRPSNASLGLMLESASARLCEPGMPHHLAPDKRPERRLRMIGEAGSLKIPFTTGILIGIGETPRERIEALLAIRRVHRAYGHIQEVIVQSFRAKPEIAMARAPDPTEQELLITIAAARLILDDEIVVQAPPNLSPGSTRALLSAGINDFGGISPVTPDYINPEHPWPHLAELAASCARAGFELRPRLPIHDAFATRADFVDPSLVGNMRDVAERMAS